MTGANYHVRLAAAALLLLASAACSRAPRSYTLVGAVLRDDSDPRRQMPIPNVRISATDGRANGSCSSDVAGFFRLVLSPLENPAKAVSLRFEHAGYQPLEITETPDSKIDVIRMTPLTAEPPASSGSGPKAPIVTISNLRLRYSVKNTSTVNIGSAAKTFEAPNKGGMPCNAHLHCSPDGKWRASNASAAFDAGAGNIFREVRVSCIAGPCPFTKIESTTALDHGRIVKVSTLNWSDTTTFLIEAEVTRTMVSDLIRETYPVIFGGGMDFTLPAAAEGPSLEAELNGSDDIVFPLGPDLYLSWANCSKNRDADGSNLYRCQLKPGYQLR